MILGSVGKSGKSVTAAEVTYTIRRMVGGGEGWRHVIHGPVCARAPASAYPHRSRTQLRRRCSARTHRHRRSDRRPLLLLSLSSSPSLPPRAHRFVATPMTVRRCARVFFFPSATVRLHVCACASFYYNTPPPLSLYLRNTR